MSEGIRSALPAQFQQKSALDRGHRGKTTGSEAEPFNTVLGQSQSRSTVKGAEAERAGDVDTGDGPREQKAAKDKGDGEKETDNAVEGDGEGLSGVPFALFGADKVVGAAGRATPAGASENGEAPARPDRFTPIEGKPRPVGAPADDPRTSGRATAHPQSGQGLRAFLLNGAAPDATAAGSEGQSAGAAAKSLPALAVGTGQAGNGEPAAALQHMFTGRGTPGAATREADGGKRAVSTAGEPGVRASGAMPEAENAIEAKDSEQPSRRVEGRGETGRRDSRQESPFRPPMNATDGKSLETAGGKVNVVGAQNTPAPAPPASGSTASALVGALDADGSWKPMLAEAATIARGLATRGGEVMRSINIQLQPASLGTVTARLSVQGDQISVDLQVETTEARQRLATDSDAIVKSLRALGYEVDRVTVQQAQQPAAGNGAQNSAGRGTSFQAETGHGGASGERSRNGQGDRPGDGGQRYGGAGSQGQANAGRDGVYI